MDSTWLIRLCGKTMSMPYLKNEERYQLTKGSSIKEQGPPVLVEGWFMAHEERGLLDLIEGWLMAHKVRMDETKMLSPYRPRTDQRIPTPVAFCGFWGPFTVSSAGIFPGVGGLIGGWNRVSERVSYVGHEFGRERFRGERHRRGFVKK
ncbi:hypothetical protein WG66_005401 [Moniliophthora roreri]|nr:hypothetical protein WG66_005401 [Moniliophthora roreri]